VILITGISLLFIDRSCLLESLSRSWTNFDEDKRSGGPLGFGSNQTAAYLGQFAMFFWGFAQFLKRKKAKLLCYALVAATIFAILYTFSRGAYLAVLVSAFILGALKDRKLLLLGVVFLLTWQLVVPNAVRQRVNMTQTASGQLEASAKERVRLWEDAEASILSDPIFGTGFATYQLTYHIDNLRDTHNWYVKVMVETGIIGLAMIAFMLQQMLALAYRLFRKAEDPLYRGLGLGLFLAICSCIIANFFGDRWTYFEITGPLWVLVGAAVCASQMPAFVPATEQTADDSTAAVNPYLVYR
jgi:O-antigen ligase